MHQAVNYAAQKAVFIRKLQEYCIYICVKLKLSGSKHDENVGISRYVLP